MPFLILILVSLFLLSLFFIGFNTKKNTKVKYLLTIDNIDKNKNLNWYKKEIKNQINCLLFYPISEKDNVVKYKAPLLYSVNEDYLELEINTYYIEIKSSKMVQKILENRLEIENKNWL